MNCTVFAFSLVYTHTHKKFTFSYLRSRRYSEERARRFQSGKKVSGYCLFWAAVSGSGCFDWWRCASALQYAVLYLSCPPQQLREEEKVDQVVRSRVESRRAPRDVIFSTSCRNNIDGTVAGVGQYCHYHRPLRKREHTSLPDGTVPVPECNMLS